MADEESEERCRDRPTLLHHSNRGWRDTVHREEFCGVPTLAKQMQLRFGPLTPATEARLEAAGEVLLYRWTERILTAGSFDELFA